MIWRNYVFFDRIVIKNVTEFYHLSVLVTMYFLKHFEIFKIKNYIKFWSFTKARQKSFN